MVQGLVKVGKLTRAHGIKGAELLYLDGEGRPDPRKTKVFFLEINGVHTPFFAEEIKLMGKNLVLLFDTVNTMAGAQGLCGKEVWVEQKNLVKEKKLKDLTGYQLVDAHKGNLGTIQQILEMPGQRMFSLQVNNKEVLLPFNEELIEKTDTRKRIIFYKAPDGLLDIYLEP